MQRDRFYASLRARGSGVFGTSLSRSQVNGIEAILDACIRHGVVGAHYVANILAQVYRETGGRMSPVREAFADSDAQAIARLETAWKAGKLKGVTKPYWREGWYGRGPIQISLYDNYLKFEKRLGIPLTKNRELAMDPVHGADIAVIGMKEGLFRARKLSDYNFPSALDAPPASNPRRIVNGNDGSDKEVARFHRAFYAALMAGGYSAVEVVKEVPTPSPEPVDVPKPVLAPEVASKPQPAPAVKSGGFWAALFSAIGRMLVVVRK
jgi:predicted chitinase